MKPKMPKLLLSALILITLDLAVAGTRPAEAGPGFDAAWWAFNTIRNYRFGDINRDLDRLEWRMRQQSSESASPKPASSNRGYKPKNQGYTALSQATTSRPQNRHRQRLYRARGYGNRHHFSRFRRF
jgi:hypothetical protein